MSAFRPEGIIFDVDGVLFDTERLGYSVWREVGAEMGCSQAPDHYLSFVGRSRADILEDMAARFGPDFPGLLFMETCSARAKARTERDGIPLKPGVRKILQFLNDQHIPVALASSTYSERSRYRMEKTGLARHFQSMTTGDQVAHSKPDPEIYQLACRRLGTAPARTIAVEDSRNGILSAHSAGMKVVMIPDLVPPTEELDQLLFRRFASLMELQDYLTQTL